MSKDAKIEDLKINSPLKLAPGRSFAFAPGLF